MNPPLLFTKAVLKAFAGPARRSAQATGSSISVARNAGAGAARETIWPRDGAC